jgi:hypothetical protein
LPYEKDTKMPTSSYIITTQYGMSERYLVTSGVYMQAVTFHCGDVVFFEDNSWMSKTIKWFTRAKGESKTRFSHVGMMLGSNCLAEEKKQVTIQNAEERLLSEGKRQVWRPLFLTTEQKATIINYWLLAEGRKYGWWANIPHILDGFISKFIGDARLFRRLPMGEVRTNCSGRVSIIFRYAVGMPLFEQIPGTESPDCLHDYIIRSENWEKIAEFKDGKLL